METEVVKVTRRSFLSKFNARTGWYTNWAELSEENEIYALVLKGTVDIQGMVAVSSHRISGCLYIAWAVAAPQNNKELVETKRYNGVGGHLLAIAAQKSVESGFHGDMTGFAMDKKLVNHYCSAHGAEYLGMLHEFQIAFDALASEKLMEVYTYEWSEDEL